MFPFQFMVAMLCGWSQREQEEVIAFLREECGRTPASAPNCNAHAERLIQSIKTECLDRVVPLGERHLRHLVRDSWTTTKRNGIIRASGTSSSSGHSSNEQAAPLAAAGERAAFSITTTGRQHDWPARSSVGHYGSAGNTNDTSQFDGGATMPKRTLVCVVLCGLLASGSLLAHHSLAGVYDMDKESELTGLVDSIKFVNPHGSLAIVVNKEDGTSVKWTFTLGSATRLAQRGIGPTGQNALHQGDKITVKFIPARNGSPLGFLTSVKMPDGRVLNISSGNPND